MQRDTKDHPGSAYPHVVDVGGVGERGFTLVELVMVILMLGILSVFAVPRIFDRGDFDARGLHDVTLSYLRYAQKSAIAQRRTVCVSFTTSTISLRIAIAAGVFDCAGASGMDLNGPDGNTSGSANGAAYSGAAPTAFGFDALGQPVDTGGNTVARATIQVANAARAITIEAITGYVHD